MFKYLAIGILLFWIYKRVFRIKEAVKEDSSNNNNQPNSKKDNHGGDYVDYEEIE